MQRLDEYCVLPKRLESEFGVEIEQARPIDDATSYPVVLQVGETSVQQRRAIALPAHFARDANWPQLPPGPGEIVVEEPVHRLLRVLECHSSESFDPLPGHKYDPVGEATAAAQEFLILETPPVRKLASQEIEQCISVAISCGANDHRRRNIAPECPRLVFPQIACDIPNKFPIHSRLKAAPPEKSIVPQFGRVTGDEWPQAASEPHPLAFVFAQPIPCPLKERAADAATLLGLGNDNRIYPTEIGWRRGRIARQRAAQDESDDRSVAHRDLTCLDGASWRLRVVLNRAHANGEVASTCRIPDRDYRREVFGVGRIEGLEPAHGLIVA